MEDQRTYYRDKEGSHTLDEQRPEQTLEWARNSHCIPLGQKKLGYLLGHVGGGSYLHKGRLDSNYSGWLRKERYS